MARIYCAIERSVFSVDIDANQLVGDFKGQIKEKKPITITCDADDLELFVAKKGSRWIAEIDVINDVRSTVGITRLESMDKFREVGLSEADVRVEVSDQDCANGYGPVNVLVVMPTELRVSRPCPTAITEPEKFAEECDSLTEWSVDAVHEIPLVWNFMRSLGGCTKIGEIFWRMEDKQVVSLLVDGWFRESSPSCINVNANKKSIIMGSPGVGKSILLCVMAFYLLFKHQKNVLVYRQLTALEEGNYLVYLATKVAISCILKS